METPEPVRLLGAADVRGLADELGLRPTKKMGQNFVHDANTVRRIVRLADVAPGDVVLEVGPGLGSLTLALLDAVGPTPGRADGGDARSSVAGGADAGGPGAGVAGGADAGGRGVAGAVVAVELDPLLARRLPATVAERAPGRALHTVTADALRLRAADLAHVPAPTALVANLPYNVAVPVVLHLLAELPSLQRGLVMVQSEVADRLAAGPGETAYGSPSAKLAWYGTARRAGPVPRAVFWPVPGVDSGLVAFARHDEAPPHLAGAPDRAAVFAVVDAAFAQRRKSLRAALAGWAGSPALAEEALRAAGVDPGARGEALGIAAFAAIAAARRTEPV